MKLIIKMIMMSAVVTAVSCKPDDLNERNIPPLPAPELRLIDGDIVGWNHISGAVYYITNLNGEDLDRTAENALDLSIFGEGEYSVKVKAVGDGKKHSDSQWSEVLNHTVSEAGEDDNTEVEPEPEPDKPVAGVLATPILRVTVPSFAAPTEAYVTWMAVENADSYIVKVDDAEVPYVDCRADLNEFIGEHVLTVQAVNIQNPEEYEPSEIASFSFSIKNYGSGTSADPYLIYTVDDWNQMADVINNAQGTYMDKFVALAGNLDCNGATLKTVGVNSTKNMAGTFDGKDNVISNARLGGEDASAVGLFAYVRGTIKNLVVDNCTVVAGADVLSRSAVISGGQTSGRIEKCSVSNSSVSITASNGSYGAIIAGQLSGENAVISECSVQKCTLTVTKEHVGAICGSVTGGNTKVLDCTVSETKVSARNNTGGIVGVCSNSVTISGCQISNSEISSIASVTGGIIGDVNHESAIIDGCSSIGNKITSGTGSSNTGGIVGQISVGCVINCISDQNTVASGKSVAGGIVGIMKDGRVINNISRGCLVTTETSAVSDQYVSLVVGSDDATAKGICNNNVVVSGNVKYGPSARKYVGIISGKRGAGQFGNNYYSAAIITEGDLTNSSNDIGPIGQGISAGLLTLGGSYPIGEGYEPALSDLHSILNSNIDAGLSTTYPTIKKWKQVSGGWPTFE